MPPTRSTRSGETPIGLPFVRYLMPASVSTSDSTTKQRLLRMPSCPYRTVIGHRPGVQVARHCQLRNFICSRIPLGIGLSTKP